MTGRTTIANLLQGNGMPKVRVELTRGCPHRILRPPDRWSAEISLDAFWRRRRQDAIPGSQKASLVRADAATGSSRWSETPSRTDPPTNQPPNPFSPPHPEPLVPRPCGATLSPQWIAGKRRKNRVFQTFLRISARNFGAKAAKGDLIRIFVELARLLLGHPAATFGHLLRSPIHQT